MDVAGDKMHAPADAKSPPPQDDTKPPEKETSFQVEVKPESDSDAEDDKSDASEGAWETESLYEDALQLVADEQLRDGITDVCSLEEAIAFRKHLRTVGKAAFVRDTIGRGSVTAKKLCTAFRIIPPLFLQDAPDEAYYPLLSIGIEREYTRREKLPQYNTIDDAVDLMKSAKNIIVLTGAGISTSLGIPDFRSKDIGLYSKLAHLGLSDPQEVFDIDLFREDPSLFYSIAKDILPEGNKFTPTHAFIRLLQDKEKLLTNFTQNIDNLEANAGVLPENLIQCHGSFATATCIKCSRSVPGQGIFDRIRMGQIPECEACAAELKSQGLKRKRGNNDSGKMARKLSNDSSDDEYAIPTPGVMKPDITFFGEDLPDSFRRRLIEHDRDRVDLVIVIGTSLKVAPVGDVPGILPSNVPQIFINRDPVSHIEFDIDMLGDCDVVVSELCRRAGWEIKHDMITEDEKVVVEPVPGHPSRYEFRAEKSS